MSKTLKLVTLFAALVAGLSAAYFMGYLPKQITELTSTEVTSEAPVAQASQKAAPEEISPEPPRETKPAPIKETEPVEEVEPPAEPVALFS